MKEESSKLIFPSAFEEHTIAEFNRLVSKLERLEKEIQVLKQELIHKGK